MHSPKDRPLGLGRHDPLRIFTFRWVERGSISSFIINIEGFNTYPTPPFSRKRPPLTKSASSGVWILSAAIWQPADQAKMGLKLLESMRVPDGKARDMCVWLYITHFCCWLRLNRVITLDSLKECMWWGRELMLSSQVWNLVPCKKVSFVNSGAIFTDLWVLPWEKG